MAKSLPLHRKRKAADLANNDEGECTSSPPKKTKKQPVPPTTQQKPKKAKGNEGEEPVEKRLRRYRAKAPLSYHDIAERALTQRLCILERQRTGDFEETIEIAGTTGNVYTVKINEVPSCDCPHAQKGNQCKHIVYVLKRTLRAPENLAYQLALLPSELREIFAQAPPIPTAKGRADADGAAVDENADPNRKPLEDDCPICCVEFEPGNDDIVWCKAACGNNVHRSCLEKWAMMKTAQSGQVTCPFCRTPWQDDDHAQNLAKNSATVGPDGYRNVAGSLGLSGYRDYSTYHPFWVMRQRRLAGGRIEDELLQEF